MYHAIGIREQECTRTRDKEGKIILKSDNLYYARRNCHLVKKEVHPLNVLTKEKVKSILKRL